MARILIAEDDAHVMRVLSMWLSRNGHEPIEARDGLQAREAIAQGGVDLLVSDMNMPGMNGLQLVEWARTQHGSTVPIVVLSSRCDQDSIAADLRRFGVRVLPKPFSPSRLVVEIERLLAPVSSSSE